MAAKASNEEGSFKPDLRGVLANTDRGSRFWNSFLVEIKFSVERSWIKSVRKPEKKPNYGMTNMDGLLEEVVGNKLELCGLPIDSILKEIGQRFKREGNSDSQELEDFISAQKSSNTVKKTKSDIRALKRFCSTIDETREPETMTAKELDKLLSRFFKDIT